MDCSIGSSWIVWDGLVSSPYQRLVEFVPELVDDGNCALMLEQRRMQLFHISGGQLSFSLDECEHPFQSIGVVLNDSGHVLGILIRRLVLNQRSINALLNQEPGDPAIQRIDPLDDSGFNGPFSLNLSEEFRQHATPLESSALADPDAMKRPEFSVRERAEVRGQVRDRLPRVVRTDTIHVYNRNPSADSYSTTANCASGPAMRICLAPLESWSSRRPSSCVAPRPMKRSEPIMICSSVKRSRGHSRR